MTDLERVRDALRRLADPYEAMSIIDAHLKEDAQREAWRQSQLKDAAAELAELREELKYAQGGHCELYAKYAKLREAVRALKDQPCDTTIIVNRDVWNRLRQLIEEKE